jgi:hypothetical protein
MICGAGFQQEEHGCQAAEIDIAAPTQMGDQKSVV